jgi:2,5-dihydroxypyridine 5,6-dioxygenase
MTVRDRVLTVEEVFRRELEMCGVNEGDTVAILSHGTERGEYADLFLGACRQTGAAGVHVRLLPPRPMPLDVPMTRVDQFSILADNEAAVDMLKRADLVIDLVFLLYAPELYEILGAGTRVLSVLDPLSNLIRLFPTTDLRERTEAGEELLRRASSLRVTSPGGTDVTYSLGVYPVTTQYGYTDTAGRWDLWPSGFLFTGGADDGVDGKVVLSPGDAIVLPHLAYVREPVEFTIEQGRVVDVRGGVEASLLAEYMEAFNDPQVYGISHIGWGLNEKSKWNALAMGVPGNIGMDNRSYYGNVMFSTGPNLELGGTNDTACHIDLPMRGCSLFLDDEPIILDGDVVVDEMKAPGR